MRSKSLLIVTLFFLFSFSSQSMAKEEIKNNFLIGGQIPSWLIAGEEGEPSGAPGADKARLAVQPRAKEMFDVVIPSSVTWDWVEKKRGVLDFHYYEWARDWADKTEKDILVQHILWSWAKTKPDWVKELNDDDLRQVVMKHIQDVRDHVGSVSRITVINEMLCKEAYLTDRLGDEIIKDIFDKAREVFPDTELFLNEVGCPSIEKYGQQTMHRVMNNYADMVLKFEKQDIDFDRIGLQSYFGKGDVEALGGIDVFVKKYSDAVNHFKNKTGHKIIITELGFASIGDEDYKANFLRAFFTMALQNPNIEGLFVFHWLDDQQKGTALINRDGSLTKGGEVFYEVFGR